MPQQSFLTALFGKKRKAPKRRRSARKSVAKKTKGSVNGSKPPAALRNKCKKLKVRTTTGKKTRTYKSITELKRQCRRRERVLKKKMLMKKKKELMKKKAAKAKRVKKRKAPKRRKRKRSRRSSSRFGKGVPLSQIMSPYPYSVGSSPPWV